MTPKEMTLRGLMLTATIAAFAGVFMAGRATGDPAANVAPKDRAAIEAIVHDYILAHPEILPEAMAGMEARTGAKAIAENRKAIETPFAGAVGGAPNGDVRLAVFFDYACPYCKAANADVQKLIASDRKLTVVFRDFPVLGDASTAAALASLSAAKQGRYTAFHDALFDGAGRLSGERVEAAEKVAGLDATKVTRDAADPALKAEIARNLDLARKLQISGTPSYVVGDKLLQGRVGYDALKAAVAEARAAAG